MIRINGYDFNGNVQYPSDRIVLLLVTTDSFTDIFQKVCHAESVSIINDGDVVASYGCTFNGIEKGELGYRVIFNRNPMSQDEVYKLEADLNDLKIRVALLEKMVNKDGL